jgi:hypothetical protein
MMSVRVWTLEENISSLDSGGEFFFSLRLNSLAARLVISQRLLIYGTPLITKALGEDGGGSARMVGASVRMAEARRGW